MTPPDALVTIEGGVADVDIRTPGLVIEVRDYDVDGVEVEMLWTDERGDRCVRYFAEHENRPATQEHTSEPQLTPPGSSNSP